MNKTKILFLFLPFSLMACSLTAQVTPQPVQRPKAAILSHEQRSLIQAQGPISQVCIVKTGFADGRLNLRACGGLACPVLAVIGEGETLTPSQTVNGWHEVQADGLHGWVNSKYCSFTENNEVKK